MEIRIQDKCHVKSNNGNDGFVGIKYEKGDISINFPMGFHLSDDEKETRQDIFLLIKTISNTVSNRDSILHNRQNNYDQVEFPMRSYLEVIYDFMDRGYYREREATYDEKTNGKISWSRTIKKEKPFIHKHAAYYLNFITKRSVNKEEMITLIHKYVVYECFEKIGWLFTIGLPENPHIQIRTPLFLKVISNKLMQTNNDKDKVLFLNMIAVLQYLSDRNDSSMFFYGTYRFEYVWEKLVDRVFGIEQKVGFFPSTTWIVNGSKYSNSLLEPDSIMLFDGNIYVLDAKYYKFGVTSNPWDLPGTSSISKQIVYGEYISTNKKFKMEFGNNFKVFNAFIMPFDSACNKFNSDNPMVNVATAISEWKLNQNTYEHIRGVLVDTKYLMKASRQTFDNMNLLAKCIANEESI